MATILELNSFRSRPGQSDLGRQLMSHAINGEVVIFPGIRYERHEAAGPVIESPLDRLHAVERTDADTAGKPQKTKTRRPRMRDHLKMDP